METLAYRTVRDLWCDLCGLEISTLQNTDKATFSRLFSRVIRRAWRWYPWPQLLDYEERFFRPEWPATSFSEDDEVYHAGTDAYWRANAAAISTDVPGVAAVWDEITDLDAYVAYAQTGETAFDLAVAVWDQNFRTTRGAVHLPWEYDERGVRMTGGRVPTSVWLQFLPRCPEWTGADYDATATYGSGQRRYYASANTGFEGDYWTTNQATSAGQSPETHPAKWDKVAVPTFLVDFAVNAAKIGKLEGDGELEKALADVQGELWKHLYDERARIETQPKARRARVANV